MALLGCLAVLGYFFGSKPTEMTPQEAKRDADVAMVDRENPQEAVEAPSSPIENSLASATLDPPPRSLGEPDLAPRTVATAKPRGNGELVSLVSTTPPPLSPVRPALKPDASRTLQRLDTATEEELRQQVAMVPEIALGPDAPTVLSAYLTHAPANEAVLGTPNLSDARPLLEVRPDLRRLPLRFGENCRLNGKAAVNLDRLSRKLRVHLNRIAPPGPDGQRGSAEILCQTLRAEMRGKRPEWLRAEAVPTLMQLLMPEDKPLRLMLVELLAQIEAPVATTALARRAAFDLDRQVREAAVAALKGRPAAAYRPILLKVLRYPWAPPAQHAAEALALLKDSGSVPWLVSLLKLPDPAGAQALPKNRHIIQEVVRVNHLNNCLMCHPPAATAQEPVLGVDPVLSLPATAPSALVTGARQVQSLPGGHNYGGARNGSAPLLIRGDITFLRQDFSIQQPVRGPVALQVRNALPRQRFDYVVRTRLLSRSERDRLEESVAHRPSYPQRDAVLFALRTLTGKDAGPTTEAWLQLFPNAQTDVEAARLSGTLVKAEGLEGERLLAKYRDAKGIVYTQALACAISSLNGVRKERTRTALVERLTRMSATTLREKFRDEDPEIRRAAVMACARKEEKQLIPDLIELLDNPEPLTARLAEEGLTHLTGEQLQHPAAWKSWWQTHGGERPVK